MKTVTIEVTQEDIEKGRPYSSSGCPIALASLRAIGLNWGELFSRLPIVNDYWPTVIPQEVTDFILDFDKNRPVKPFSFDITYQEL